MVGELYRSSGMPVAAMRSLSSIDNRVAGACRLRDVNIRDTSSPILRLLFISDLQPCPLVLLGVNRDSILQASRSSYSSWGVSALVVETLYFSALSVIYTRASICPRSRDIDSVLRSYLSNIDSCGLMLLSLSLLALSLGQSESRVVIHRPRMVSGSPFRISFFSPHTILCTL